MLSGVIALGTMGDGRERAHASPDEPQQEVNKLRLRVRMRDALLTNESLAALPIALTVHLACAFWSPVVVEITGRVRPHGSRSGSCRGGAQELRPPRGSWSNR